MPFIAAPVAAALIGGGASVAGGLIAKRGSNNIANMQQQLAQDQLARTKPAYDSAYNYYQNILSGQPGAMQAAIAPEINATNAQYKSALHNILNSQVARGGAMDRVQRQLEGQRAGQLSNLYYGLRPNAAAALGSLATGGTSQALNALQGASQTQFNNAQANAQAIRGIGGFLANLLSTPGLFGGQAQGTPPFVNPGPISFAPRAVINPYDTLYGSTMDMLKGQGGGDV